MKTYESGFSAVSILPILLAIGITGFIGWYVWQGQKSESTNNKAINDTSSSTQKDTEPLSLAETKLPAGWMAEIEEPGRILLSNTTSKCFTDVLYSTDTAESNSPNVDQNKQTVDAIKSKGYSVEETKGKLTIVTSSGEKQIDAQILKVTGINSPMFQNYAYITKSDSYTRIQLSCPNESDVQTAQTALKAIVLYKQ